jgi:ankyrin repeat protein
MVWGRTPLCNAAKGAHADVVQLLLNAKVDAEAKDSVNWTALFFAATGAHGEVVKLLLDTVEVNLNAEDLRMWFNCYSKAKERKWI